MSGAADTCLACDLASGRRPLPGGLIHETGWWRVEHCVGPLGLGTLVVKPKRHVTRVSELTEPETGELGPLLRDAAAVVDELLRPEQVYVCLWSHAGGRPGHIHYVVQPVTKQSMETHGVYGPALQVAMFDLAELPAANAVASFAQRASAGFSGIPPSESCREDVGGPERR